MVANIHETDSTVNTEFDYNDKGREKKGGAPINKKFTPGC